MAEKYIESLHKAMKNLQIADHMAYVTYPIVKDKRLLLKIIENIYESVISTINAILQYEYLWKRIQLYKDAKSNFEVFTENCAERYSITKEQIRDILGILSIAEQHKKSPLEFMRKEKVIIMSDNMKTTVVDIDLMKKYLILSKQIIQNTISRISIKE